MEASIRERREGWKGERDQHPPRQTPSNALTNSSISSHVPTPRAAHLAVPFPHRRHLLPAHEPQLRAPTGTDAQHEHPAKRREPLPDLLLLPVHLAEPRVGARRRCAPPGPSSGLWSRRRPWRGGRRGRNDAEALVVVRVSDKDKAGCWPPQPPRLRLKRAKASRARWGGAGWRA